MVIERRSAALARNGSPRHVLALTAMRPGQDWHLAAIGLARFTAATIGYQHRRRHRPGDTPHVTGMGGA